MTLTVCILIFAGVILDPASWTKKSIRSSLPLRFELAHAETGDGDALRRLVRQMIPQVSITDVKENAMPIILVMGTYSYRLLVLNFLCGLRNLAIDHVLVLAMDPKMFDFLRERDIHVFLHDDFKDRPFGVTEGKDVQFGSEEFVAISKAKTSLVLQVLEGGADVLLSDADVIWFRNPIAHMAKIMREIMVDLVIQSDARLGEAPNFNVCSGFYLVRSSNSSISAFRAIHNFEMKNTLSEQKSFNFVYCGAFKNSTQGPGTRIGSTSCMYKKHQSKLSTLDPKCFSNGDDDESILANGTNESDSHFRRRPCQFIYHANFRGNLTAKLDFLKRRKLWMLQTTGRRWPTCTRLFTSLVP